MKKILGICTIIFLVACNGGVTGESEHGHEHGHGGGPEGSSVVLTPNQMQSLNLTLDSIHHQPLSDILNLTGLISVPPQYLAHVTAPIEGIVQSIQVKEGEFVTKGQNLVTLTNPLIIQMQQDLLENRSKMFFDEAEYQRQLALSTENVNAKKALQQAQSNLGVTRARTASLEKQLSLIGINPSTLNEANMVSTFSIKAPVSGTISQILASIGSRCTFELPIMKIVDNEHAILELFVFEDNLKKLQEGQIVKFTLTSDNNVFNSAKITTIGSSFENESKAIKVLADIEGDKSGLIDQMNVNAIVSLKTEKVACVQNGAVVNYQGTDFIFVYSELSQHDLLHSGHEHEDEHESSGEHAHEGDHEDETQNEPVAGSIAFIKIPVKKGVTSGGFTEVIPLLEIPADSRIVVNGSFYVLAALTNQGEAHSH